MTLSRLLPALSLVVVLALAGCGGDDESSSDSGSGGEDAGAVYSEAVAGLDKLKSGKLQAQLDTVLELNDQEIKVGEKATFSGEGGTALPEFDVDIRVDQTGGATQETEAVNVGDEFYVRPNGSTKFQTQGAQAVDALKTTYKREQEALDAGRLPLLSLTPADWAKEPKIDGTTDFGGVTVQRVKASVDVPAFLKDLETGKNSEIGMGVSLTKDARKLLEPGADVDKAELVALVGEEDGKLRRLTVSVDGNVGGGVKVDFDVQLSELDEPQEISPPTGGAN